ncbi:fimbria/pilus outer membrane usher protein [Pantoea dispersa]
MPYIKMPNKFLSIYICTCFLWDANAWGDVLHFDENLIAANGISSEQLNDALNRYVLPEGYRKVEVYINGFYTASGGINSMHGLLIFTRAVKSKLKIKGSAWREYHRVGRCAGFILDKKISYKFDRSDNALRIIVPAELLEEPAGRMSFRGGRGAFINYNTYAYRYSSVSGMFSSLNADYEAGGNVNNTIIRVHGNYSQFRSENGSSAVNQVRDGYIERDFNRVRIRAGRTIVNDGGFGTGYVDGAIVSSAEGNASAYINFSYDAPEVLSVEFWQNNLLLWKQILQKGHAELRNIPVAGFSSDVTVLVKRQDQVIYSQIISRGQITTNRYGMTGYYAFSGRAVNGARRIVNGVGFSKALGKNMAPSVAMVSSGKYRGLAVSNTTFYGEFFTTMWLTGVQNERGQRSLSLNVTTNHKNTSVSYSVNSRHFSYLGEAQQAHYRSERSSISLTQTQPLSDRITGSVSLTHYRFYRAHSNDAVSASLNYSAGMASLGIGLSYMSPVAGRSVRDKVSTNLSLSIPLSIKKHSVNWRSQYYSYAKRTRFSNSLSAQVTDRYTVTASHQRVSGRTRSESYMLDNNVSTPYTAADVSLSQGKDSGNSSRMTAVSLSGSIAVSRKGVIFSPGRISDTWAVVDTGVHRYLEVSSLRNSVVTNHDGKAIITSVAAGSADFIRVNPEGLPPGVIIKNNVREFSAERGAVPFFDFNVVNNRFLLMRWKSKPAWIQQNDLFYDAAGKLIARFIDKDVLLINENDVNELQKSGMSSPARINVQCRLVKFNPKKQESINDVIFKCNGA